VSGVRRDIGGWISGPAIGRDPGMPPAEPVRAAEIRCGDIIAYDGRLLTVTIHPVGAWYLENGEHVSGLAVTTQDGGAHWTLYRRGSDLVMRVMLS